MNEWMSPCLNKAYMPLDLVPFLWWALSWATRAPEQGQQCHSDKKKVQALRKGRVASGSHAMVGVSYFSEEHIPEHINNVCDIENSYKYITSCLSFKPTMGSNVILKTNSHEIATSRHG